MSKPAPVPIKPKANDETSARENAGSFWVALPGFASVRAKRIFLALAVVLLAFAVSFPILTRKLVFYRQANLPESQLWNAARALDRGELDRAKIYVERVISTTITQELEGNALYYLAPNYHELAVKLFAHGMATEARAVEYKGLRHYHRINRYLEYIDPWMELEKHYIESDFPKFLNIFDLITAHSLGNNREIIVSAPSRWDSLREYGNTRGLYYNVKPEMVMATLRGRSISPADPDFQISFGLMNVRTSLRLNDKEGAAAAGRMIAEKQPARLDARALLAEAERGQNAVAFTDELKTQPGYAVFDFGMIEAAETEYKPPEPIAAEADGSAWLRIISAAEMNFESPDASDSFYLVASGTEFLDIHPIVLVTVNGGEVFPLYVDHPEPTMFALNLPVKAGANRIRFDFLNDSRVALRDVVYDRDVHLMRLVVPRTSGAGR